MTPDENGTRYVDLPSTLRTVPGEDVTQKLVFDPSMKQHQDAYRAADPAFADPARTEAWRAARRRALEAVLRVIGGSEWADALVLRGSMLMTAWFGEAAREPGDLDFVVVPRSWGLGDPRTARMLDGIAKAAEGAAQGFDAAGAVAEDIWTYERVPGRRLVLPWTAPGLPGGHVQLDFVFGERLPEEPEPVELPGGAVLLGATPALSLAWKVLWLTLDTYSQGKDLYDAVLLAERHPLPYALLHAVFEAGGEWPEYHRHEVRFEDVAKALRYVEWRHFVAEFPRFADAEGEFVRRLLRALAATFGSEGGDAVCL
ncbi:MULTISPECIES: nucleotidyl transferase AbiEii/AbiGii toxin family protein [unclassified Streptomyces]|uniref:nucleotidyl transferase AbiEii/AbiGii toxin family protein n=1 Tax=unclassified Streptomyces TaxID=2593676 RepID=UPI000DD83BE0|nr:MULTISPECIES: nucleotidyl transferase AbiEii/AbiGii toxin family protein [unclassified Streptomyces]QZZ27676.1 nucleotidyl transferase AbiEii/AbiGii toxin family protein [Streptomyces sp. ST1015]